MSAKITSRYLENIVDPIPGNLVSPSDCGCAKSGCGFFGQKLAQDGGVILTGIEDA
jgi:hypothetical protein